MKIIGDLPIYEVSVKQDELKKLKSDIWCEDPVPAVLAIDSERLGIKIKYRGSHIRKFREKSYNIVFKNQQAWNGAKELHLNAEYKDPSLLRNKLSFDLFTDIGCLAPRSRHILLTLNGRVEGIYLEIEAVDHNFLLNRKLPEGAIYYAVDGDANFSLMSEMDRAPKTSLDAGYERKFGSSDNDVYLQQLIFKINTLNHEQFEKEIVKIVDVEKYLRWIAGVVLTQNYDGFVHNYALYRNGETGLFEVIPWDYDATWGRDVNGKFMDADYVRIEGFNTLTARMLGVENFRKKYKTVLHSIIGDTFSIKNLKPKIEKLHSSIRPYVGMDPYKNQRLDKFDKEPAIICTFIEERTKYLLRQIVRL